MVSWMLENRKPFWGFSGYLNKGFSRYLYNGFLDICKKGFLGLKPKGILDHCKNVL